MNLDIWEREFVLLHVAVVLILESNHVGIDARCSLSVGKVLRSASRWPAADSDHDVLNGDLFVLQVASVLILESILRKWGWGTV